MVALVLPFNELNDYRQPCPNLEEIRVASPKAALGGSVRDGIRRFPRCILAPHRSRKKDCPVSHGAEAEETRLSDCVDTQVITATGLPTLRNRKPVHHETVYAAAEGRLGGGSPGSAGRVDRPCTSCRPVVD